MLKPNDFVKYHRQDLTLTDLGFELGRVYRVTLTPHDKSIQVDRGDGFLVPILDVDGELTDYADHFAKYVPETKLPIGVS